MLRCEYDRDHRIKGRWQAIRCRQAFPEAYKARLYEEYEEVREQQEAAAAAKSGGRKVKVKVEAEKPKPLRVKVEKQQPLKSESGRKVPPQAPPQARPAVPVVTVELGPEPKNLLPSVDSIPGVKALKTGVAEVWDYGLWYSWIQLKETVADCHERISWSFTYFVNSLYGN